MKKFNIKVNGNAYSVEVEEVGAAPAAAPAAAAPVAAAPVAAAPAAAAPVAAAGEEVIAAPMPGTIVSIPVKAGEAVTKGQVLVVFEAMKMEQEVMAPHDGTVGAVYVAQGESVDTGKALLSLN